MHHHQTNFSYLLTVRWTIDLCFTNIFLYLLANSWPNTLLVTLKFILMIRWQQFALIFSDCQRNIPLFLWFAVIFFTLLILLLHINNDFFHFKGNPFVCLLHSDILRMVTFFFITLFRNLITKASSRSSSYLLHNHCQKSLVLYYVVPYCYPSSQQKVLSFSFHRYFACNSSRFFSLLLFSVNINADLIRNMHESYRKWEKAWVHALHYPLSATYCTPFSWNQ